MSKEPFMNPDYKPNENTRNEIEKLHKDGVSLSGINLKYANMKNTLSEKFGITDFRYQDTADIEVPIQKHVTGTP